MIDKRILYVCQQINPFIQESTVMADTCKALPLQAAELGNQIRIFTPRYGLVNERRNQLHEVIRLSGMNLIISDNDHQLVIKVASIPSSRQQVYFVDNEDFFRRKAIAKDPETGVFFEDNDERAMFFARGVLETIKKLRWAPEYLHIHGWMSAFIPAYIKSYYKDDPIFAKTKIVLSLYESETFSEKFSQNLNEKLISEKILSCDSEFLKEPTYDNFMKFTLQLCAGVILVGNVSDELQNFITKNHIPCEHMGLEMDTEKYLRFYESI